MPNVDPLFAAAVLSAWRLIIVDVFDPTRRGRGVVALMGLGALCLVPTAAVSTPAALFLLAFAPGRLILARILPTSGLAASGRWLLSLCISLCVAPVALDALWRVDNHKVFLLGGWVAMLVVLSLVPAGRMSAAPLANARLPRGAQGWLVSAAILWVAGCVLLSYWPVRFGDWLLPANPHDYIKHAAVMDSLSRHPLPLGNIFCAELANEPCFYYHFFYLAPATLRVLAGGVPGSAFVFGLYSALTAVATIGLVGLLARRAGAGDTGVTLAILSASLLGGFDLLPVLAKRQVTLTLDAWADLPFRIHNFYTNYVWCGQHVLGLVIVLTGCYLLSVQAGGRRWLLIGPALLVSLLGSSVYLAMVVWPCAVLYAAIVVFRAATSRDRYRGVTRVATAGVVTLIWSAPLILGYADMVSRHEASLTTTWPANHFSVLGRLVSPGVLANLLDVPTTFFLEYGLRFVACFLVGAAAYRRCWRDPGLRLLLIASVAGVAGFVTWHSALHEFDYSMKIGLYPSMALTAIFVGLLFNETTGARRWWNPYGWRLVSRRRWLGPAVGVMIVVSLPVGLFEAPATATRRFAETFLLSTGVSSARLTLAENRAARFIRDRLPPNAVVQCYPGLRRLYLVQLLGRQMGVMDPDHADVQVFKPRDDAPARQAYRDVLEAGRTPSSAEAYRLLVRHRITHLFVGRIEREHFEHLSKFDDGRYFSRVFSADRAAVYELMPTEAGTILPTTRAQTASSFGK